MSDMPGVAATGGDNGDWPRLSVVTPSFNQGRFIERCIQSVLAQRYPNFEHIVCDNCSTDGTLDILARYPHLRWISAPDRGQSDALNQAIRMSRGEIIAWINADDSYEPGAFEIAGRELRRATGHQILLGRVHMTDADGHVLRTTQPVFAGHEALVDAWTGGCELPQPGILFRREVLDRVGLLDVNLHYAMDYDLWLRMTAHYPVHTVDAVLARFTFHPDSKTGQARYRRGFRQEVERSSRRYWGSPLRQRYWRLRRACHWYTAELLTHAILYSHKQDERLDWSLVAELLRRRPRGVCQRYVLAVLGERLLGRRTWDALKRIMPRRAATAREDGE